MRALLILGITVFVWVGCGSQPVPSSIVEGTSGTITLITDLEVGYGRMMAQFAVGNYGYIYDHPDEDIQRGETVLTLVDKNGVDVTRLPVRFITRIEIDSAADEASSTSSSGTKSQVVIVFDVPPGLVPDADPLGTDKGYEHFTIRVERWRRNMTTQNKTFEKLTVFDTGTSQFDGVGWGSSSTDPIARIPITIVDDPAVDDPPSSSEPSMFSGFTDPEPTQIGPNKRTGWGTVVTCSFGACSAKFSEQIYFGFIAPDYVPNPEYTIRIPGTCTSCVPAAWEFEVDYPSERVSIENVTLDRNAKDQAYLEWSTPESTVACATSSTTQTLKLKIADRDALARGVKIAFKLRNTDDEDCQTPIDADDFVVSATAAFDINGQPMTFPTLEHDAG